MDSFDSIKREIERIIARSPVPEDPSHSKNTMEWLLRLKPDAGEALRIAALGHDIERAIEQRKVRRGDYKDYDEFKDAHALNSAKILEEIMKGCNLGKQLIEQVFFLVRHHEAGGNSRVEVLRNADSISFFHVNLPYYFARNSVEETKKRCLWGYRKLPGELKKVVAKFDYQDKQLQSLLRTCVTHH